MNAALEAELRSNTKKQEQGVHVNAELQQQLLEIKQELNKVL